MDITENMYELVEDCLRSGKSQKEYSQKAGIGMLIQLLGVQIHKAAGAITWDWIHQSRYSAC